jgi:hypothetical protein
MGSCYFISTKNKIEVMLIYFLDYHHIQRNNLIKFFIADIFQFLNKNKFDIEYNVYVDVCLSMLICAFLEKNFADELINDKNFIDDILKTIQSDKSNYSQNYPEEKEQFIKFVSNLRNSSNPFLEYCNSEFIRECAYHIVIENIRAAKEETYIGHLFKIIPLTKIYGTNYDNKWFTSLVDELVGFDSSLIKIVNSKKSHTLNDTIINQFIEECQDNEMECCFASVRIADKDDKYFHYFSLVKYGGKWILNNEFLKEDYLLFRKYKSFEELFRKVISFYRDNKRVDKIDIIKLETVIFAKDYTKRTKNFEKYHLTNNNYFKTGICEQIKICQAKRKNIKNKQKTE